MQVSLAEAIRQLRDEIRAAVVEADGQDIVFVPQSIDLELSISFTTELKAGGGLKLLALLDLSTEAKQSDSSAHKIKLSLSVGDKDGQPIKVTPKKLPSSF